MKPADGKTGYDGTMDLAKELKRLSFETEEFEKVGEATRAELLRAMSEIELAKTRIKTAEIRLVAAKKMKEAARAAEAAALAEIKAMSNNNENSCCGLQQEAEVVTISCKEYSGLMSRAREAEAACESKLASAMLQVDEANLSKAEILRKVEEAREEVQSSKKALEEALSRVENASRGKLAVEEALRKWRSERGKKRRPTHSCTKFKNAYPSHLRKDSHLHDVNGLSLVNDDELKSGVKPTMSIGQILSKKLLLTEEFENGMHRDKNRSEKGKVSLAQMLGKHYVGVGVGVGVSGGTPTPGGGGGGEEENAKQLPPAKRKKFGFGRISVLATKQSKRKKKQSGISSRCIMSESLNG